MLNDLLTEEQKRLLNKLDAGKGSRFTDILTDEQKKLLPQQPPEKTWTDVSPMAQAGRPGPAQPIQPIEPATPDGGQLAFTPIDQEPESIRQARMRHAANPELTPVHTGQPQGPTLQGPEGESRWARFKNLVLGDSHLDPIERVSQVGGRVVEPGIGLMQSTMSGALFGVDEAAWAAYKRAFPDSVDPAVKDMTFQQAMDYYAGRDPGKIESIARGVAEFAGGIHSAGRVQGAIRGGEAARKGLNVAERVGRGAVTWGIRGAADQTTTGLADHLDPDAERHYEGAVGILQDMAKGGIFGAIGSVKGPEALRTSLRSGALGGMTAAGGGDIEDIAISMALPFAFHGVGAVKKTKYMHDTRKNMLQKGYDRIQRQMKEARQQSVKPLIEKYNRLNEYAKRKGLDRNHPEVAKQFDKIEADIKAQERGIQSRFSQEAEKVIRDTDVILKSLKARMNNYDATDLFDGTKTLPEPHKVVEYYLKYGRLPDSIQKMPKLPQQERDYKGQRPGARFEKQKVWTDKPAGRKVLAERTRPDGTKEYQIERTREVVDKPLREEMFGPKGAPPAPKAPEKPTTARQMLQPSHAQYFAAKHPDAAAQIAAKTTPSRSDMKATGISRWSSTERTEFAEMLRQVLKEQVPAETPAADQEAEAPQADPETTGDYAVVPIAEQLYGDGIEGMNIGKQDFVNLITDSFNALPEDQQAEFAQRLAKIRGIQSTGVWTDSMIRQEITNWTTDADAAFMDAEQAVVDKQRDTKPVVDNETASDEPQKLTPAEQDRLRDLQEQLNTEGELMPDEAEELEDLASRADATPDVASATPDVASDSKNPAEMTMEELEAEVAEGITEHTTTFQGKPVTQEQRDRAKAIKEERISRLAAQFENKPKHELSSYEYNILQSDRFAKGISDFQETHAEVIQQAIKDGNQVPRAVLQEYSNRRWAADELARDATPDVASEDGEITNGIFQSKIDEVISKAQSPDAKVQQVGVVGDFIAHPKAREQFADVLDVPVWITPKEKGTEMASYEAGQIWLRPTSIARFLKTHPFGEHFFHEVIHAQHYKKNRGRSEGQYFDREFEKSAREGAIYWSSFDQTAQPTDEAVSGPVEQAGPAIGGTVSGIDERVDKTPEDRHDQTDTSKPSTYYRQDDDGRFVEVKDAEPYQIEGYEDFDFFIRRLSNGEFVIVEAVSGLRIPGEYNRRWMIDQGVKDTFERVGMTPEKLRGFIDASVRKDGPSPSYADYQPAPEKKEEAKPKAPAKPKQPEKPKTTDTREGFIDALEKTGKAETPDGKVYTIEESDEVDTYLVKIQEGKFVTRKGPGRPAQWGKDEAIAKAADDAFGRQELKRPAPEQPVDKYIGMAGETMYVGDEAVRLQPRRPGDKNPAYYGWGDAQEIFIKYQTGQTGYVHHSELREAPATPEKPAPKTKITDNLSEQKQARLEELKKRFKDKMNRMNMGFDPELMTITAEMAALYVEAGARSFADFAKAVVGDVGTTFKPYLKSAYLAARNMPGMEEYRDQMDSADSVDNLTAEAIEAIIQPEVKNEQTEDRLESDQQPGLRHGPGSPSGAVAQAPGAATEGGDTARAPGAESPVGQPGQAETAQADAQPRPGTAEPDRGTGQAGDHAAEPGVRGHDTGAAGTETLGTEEAPAVPDRDAAGRPERPAAAGGVRDSGHGRDREAADRGPAVNHRIADDDIIAPRGAITQLKANIKAIKLLKQLEEQDRHATPEQQKILAQFTGWGNLSQVFDEYLGTRMIDDLWGRDERWEKKWGSYYKQLKELLSDQEFQDAAASTINAHYTSREVISGMWNMAERLGFQGGTVLELGAGVGHFFGLMPEALAQNSDLVGVELDSITARILAKLYPKAKVFAKGLEDVKIKPNSADLVTGNFPFAQDGPSDAQERYGQPMNLHNYFFARALSALRPGGLVIAITTHHTMDSAKQQREYLAEQGWLIGAIRLPNTAFAANAGTEVTTDIVILQKPTHSNAQQGHPWTQVEGIDTDDGRQAVINEYFAANPDMMLGKPSMDGSMYGGRDEFTLEPSALDLDKQLSEAVGKLPENIIDGPRATFDVEADSIAAKEGSLVMEGGKLLAVKDGKLVPATKMTSWMRHKKSKQRAISFMKLRDTYQRHLELMSSPESTDDQIEDSQAQLNRVYDEYVEKWGIFNQKSSRYLSFDPGYYLVQSLEDVTTKTDTKGRDVAIVNKAAVFSQRTINPVMEPTEAESITDAMSISLSYRGKIDPGYIAKLTNRDAKAVAAELLDRQLAFNDPKTGIWESANQYLSGNVRAKLRAAQAAAKEDSAFKTHVEALERVIPETIAIKDVDFRLGATWVPADVVQDFARDILQSPGAQIRYVDALDEWTVVGSTFFHNAANTATYGTKRFKGHEILDKALNMRTIRVTDRIKDGDTTTTVFNQKETVAAEMAVEKMQAQFRRWIDRDDAVSQRLEEKYNYERNSNVVPEYDGSHLELPGSSNAYQLRDYQKNAVWRFLQTGAGVMAHAVGSGKTLAMAATAMEMRRLNLARKPLIVVQNATMEQFPAEFRKFYPNARLLVATKKDLAAKNRKTFMARIAAGDYDAVIMAQSSFDLLPNDPERIYQHIQQQIQDLKDALMFAAQAEGKDSPTVKELQKAIKKLKKKLKELLEKRAKREDDFMTFEQMGIDQLFIDEAHAYKKPPFITKLGQVKGVANSESQRAVGLYLKTRHIQDRRNNRGVVLATGTPVTNTLGEAWHMMNLATPHLLKDLNVTTFDRFVSSFAKIEDVTEMNAGQNFVKRKALSRFTNGPELLTLIRSSWDVLTLEELQEKMLALGKALPALKTGKTQNIAVPLSTSVESFNSLLKEVYQRFKNLRGKDKKRYSWVPLACFNAGKAAALDIRLVIPQAKDDPGSKVNVCADKAAALHKSTSEKRSTQLIFCDSFNPVNTSKLSDFAKGIPIDVDIDDSAPAEQEDMFLYKDLKKKLVAKGVPENEIAIAKEHSSEKAREALFKKVNAGQVRILIGSTSAMGVGLNVQERLYAIHHLDAPWFPADLEQRQGRMIRFGNENDVVEEFSYGMEKTIDAAVFAILLRKAKFIRQVLSGKVRDREFDDPAGATVLTAEQQMAALAGDPRVFEKIEIENKLRRLRLERDAHADAVHSSRQAKRQALHEIDRLTKNIPQQEQWLEQVRGQIDGDKWTLDGKDIDRKELIKTLDELIQKAVKRIEADTKSGKQQSFTWGHGTPKQENVIFEVKINGFEVGSVLSMYKAATEDAKGRMAVEWQTEPITFIVDGEDILYQGQAKTGQGVLKAMADLPKQVERRLTADRNRMGSLKKQLDEYDAIITGTFDKAAELKELQDRVDQIDRELVAESEDKKPEHIKLPGDDDTPKPQAIKVKAKTKHGKRLIKQIQKGKGPRTIVDYINDAVNALMIVGKSQVTSRRPANYSSFGHVIRSKSGNWQLNFHEAGHAIWHRLHEEQPDWAKAIEDDLITFAERDGSMASAQNASEGFAEFVRVYISNPSEIPAVLRRQVESLLQEVDSKMLDSLQDARAAYQAFQSQPILDRLKALQADRPKRKNLIDTFSDMAYHSLYQILGGGLVMHKITRRSFSAIAGHSRWAFLDGAGLIGTLKERLSRAYKSRIKLARESMQQLGGTKADFTSAYQNMIHMQQEIQRALYGVHKGREGVRVYAWGGGFDELTEGQRELLRAGGFDIPDVKVGHGHWLYLSDKSISKIKHDIGIENWEAFSLWGQYRAALERYHKKGHEYPGIRDGLTPTELQEWVDQQAQENPAWEDSFRDIQKYMDQLLLLSVLSGEHSASEAVNIRMAWEEYWPLPRQVEGRKGRKGGGGVDPDSGVRAAFGSSLPFASLDHALATRTKKAYEAYYATRVMNSMIEFTQKVNENKDIDFDARQSIARLMLPLRLDTKLAAVMRDDEQAQIIADHLNQELAEQMEMSVQELRLTGNAYSAEDIQITHPGRKLFRGTKPRAVQVVSVFRNGKRRYYQVTDPLLFDLFSMSKEPARFVKWVSDMLTGITAPWRRNLVQNIPFALWNIARDQVNAMFMGEDRLKALIPFYYTGAGLINKLKGKGLNADAVSQSELLGKALDHTTTDAHKNLVGRFKEVLAQGIILTDYKEMSLADKVAAAPGQAMSTVMKPIDVGNFLLLGRYVSTKAEESTREGAYLAAIKRGETPEQAQRAYDYSTGDYGGKAGNANLGAMIRAAGFLNPAIRMTWGQAQKLTDPDPKRRLMQMGIRIPWIAVLYGAYAALNYLLIRAMHSDDDDFETVLESMRERKDQDRLSFMAIGSRIRLPFDWGFMGAVQSYGWNSVEEWLLEDKISGEKKALALLQRARRMPMPIDIINPHIRAGIELHLNHSFFWDDDIVPPWMGANFPYNPELQTWDNMPEIYNKIGRGLKVSPIKVRYAVQNMLTRQMDDAITGIEHIIKDKPYAEPADMPYIGRLFIRRPIGWQSQSVRSLADLDAEYRSLNATARAIEEREGRSDDWRKVQRQVHQLQPARNAMRDIQRLWNGIKDEQARPKPDQEQIDRMKREMTRRARVFLGRFRQG